MTRADRVGMTFGATRCLGIISALAISVAAHAAVINVPADHATIQAAVTAAAPNDTIIVATGTYTENVTITKSLIMKGAQAGVDARGRVASETIVVPTAPGTGTFTISFNGSITIDGFKFSGGTSGTQGCIFTNVGPNNGMQIINNIFTGYSTAAIWMNRGGSDITIDKNALDGTNLNAGGTNQAIFCNGTQSYAGLFLTNNWIINNFNRYGLFCDGNHNMGESATRAPSISGNLFNNNLQGLNLGSRSFGTLLAPVTGPYGGYINNNTFSNHAANGIQAGCQHVQVSGNIFNGNAASGLVFTSFGNTAADRGAQNCSVTGNQFLNNVLTTNGTSPNFNAGIFCSATQGAGLISTNHFSNNQIKGNFKGATYTGGEIIDMENNWWGNNTGPTDATGSNSTVGCTTGPAYVADLFNTGGTGDPINEVSVSGSGIDYCPFQKLPMLAINPISVCYTGTQVVVRIRMSDVTDLIVGGQFFLQYDNTRLDFVSAAPDAAPFTVEVFESVNEGLGTIDYAVGVMAPNPGTMADTNMVMITFDRIGNSCAMANLVTFRTHTPPTRLTTAFGDPVLPLLSNLPSITIDTTPPVISPSASNMTVECDGSGNTAQINAWLASNGGASATDNCGSVTWSNNFTALSDLCGATGAATVMFTATDGCGNFSTTSATFTIQDTTSPVFTVSCPLPAIVVNADAGGCSASPSTVNPVAPTANDTCSGSAPVVGTRSDLAAINAPYPPGNTIITWTATDACNNMATCQQTVTVNSVNVMLVDVDLEGTFTTNFTRCIRFELHRCGFPGPVIVDSDVNFVNGSASASINVPCGVYDCITARDRKHTLRRTDSTFVISGVNYVADFTGVDALVGGNLNDDEFADILDFGVFVGQYNTSPGANTLCGYVPNHADISGDGVVFVEDFTFIQQNFLEGHEANCCGLPGFAESHLVGGSIRGATAGPVTRISVRELHSRGMSELAVADLNHDGWLDSQDIAAFLGGAHP